MLPFRGYRPMGTNAFWQEKQDRMHGLCLRVPIIRCARCSFRSLLMALDPESENSLARQLRMTTEVAARISRKVAEMKMNLQTLKKVGAYTNVLLRLRFIGGKGSTYFRCFCATFGHLFLLFEQFV